MIGSFWNLCRACPSMPIDKQLHSEYRSTYTWHEYTGPHQEHTVVRRAPQPPPSRPTLEPPLPRRKKCPELAYKTHEFITAADGGGIDAVDSNVVADKEVTSALPPSQLSKAISRISTEYRLQFAWPRRPQLTNGETQAPIPAAGLTAGAGTYCTTGPPKKSLSMGALKQGMVPTGPAPVHKKRPGDFDHKRDGLQASELEPLVGGTGTDTIDGVVPEGDEREEDLSDLKIAFRSVTKEEKDKENTRKVAPITSMMPPAGRPSSVQTRPIHGILQDDKADNDRAIARARKDFLIRHHLDRTTGVGDGALLPSPTREKLEPVIPRRRDDAAKEHRDEIQPRTKSSPKNSPRTGRSQSLGPTVTDRRSPKRQPPRAPSVTKEAKEKEKETKDKDKEHREKSSESERHPRPTAAGPGQHVRWSIREPATGLSTPPIPPLPPPPPGPGPAPLHRRPSQASHRKLTAEPQINGDVTGGDSSVASTPPSQTAQAPAPAPITKASPWFDDEPVVKSPPEPTRVKSPEQMIMRSPEPVNWTVPLDTGKTFTVTQNVREEPLTRPHSEAKTWAPSSVPSAPQSAPPELAAQHKSQHSQHSGYKSPESESVSLGSFSGINGHKDLDSERDSPLPTHAQDTLTKSEKEITDTVEEIKEQQSSEPSIKPMASTNLRRLEDPLEMERKESDLPATTTTAPTTTTTTTTTTSSSAPQQSYRVLEAEAPSQGSGTAGSTGGSTTGGYHVLEAPAVVPGSAQRSAASDVLEKARNRFDKFWGKGNNGTEN